MKHFLLFFIMIVTLTGCVNKCTFMKYWWFEDDEYKVYTVDYKIHGVPKVKPQKHKQHSYIYRSHKRIYDKKI